MPEKILLVEDEEKLARFVELELTHEGYTVDKAMNGRDGLDMADSGEYDLILLDIMLPGLNGLELLRRIRKNAWTPVIMLTARDAVMDKVTGLDMGADDYITKPFEIEELLARIRAALRKKEKEDPEQQGIIKSGALTLNTKRRTVDYSGTAIDLTNKEFMLLQILLENKHIVLSRDTLLERVWGYQYMGETNVVDVYVRYLRSKIDDVFSIKLIHTVRGVGYVLRDCEGA
jgi:DNA-binding response OmpR family regulator